MKTSQYKKKSFKTLAFVLVFLFATNANASGVFPQINRVDFSLSLADGFCDQTDLNLTKKHLAYCADNWRAFGFEVNSRFNMQTFGASSELANLFYLAFDTYVAGNITQQNKGKFGTTRFGTSLNAGFLYPLLADKGYNRFLISNRSQPVKLNLLFELGFGYGLALNSLYGKTKRQSLLHIYNLSLAFGTNMTFKDLPELELEIAYKLAAAWRHNLYVKLQYDFLQLSNTSSLGANILVDALWGSVNLGLGFKF